MCDTLWARGDGRSWFAKASDRPVAEPQVAFTAPRRPPGTTIRTQYLTIADPGATALVGSRPTWLWGLEHGVNEHRVAVGNEKLYTVADAHATPDGLIGMDLVRLALERARTAGDAVTVLGDLIGRHGQGGVADRAHGAGYSSSFLVADPTDAWVVETCGRSWVAAPAGPGTAISNRVSLRRGDVVRHSPDLDDDVDPQRWIAPDAVLARADRRLACTRPATDGGADVGAPPGAATMAATLRHHGGRPWGRPDDVGDPADPGSIDPVPARFDEETAAGISVCMHLRGDTATAASMIAELPVERGEPCRWWLAPGSPCVSVFVPTFATAGPAPALADPSVWWRFAALRDRVEAPGGAGAEALAAVRAVTGPLEAELWAGADELVEAGHAAGAVARFTAAADRAVRHALDLLGV